MTAPLTQVSQKHVAMKRAGEASEISNMVLFLASDESSFSTGAWVLRRRRRGRTFHSDLSLPSCPLNYSEFVADGGEVAGLAMGWDSN